MPHCTERGWTGLFVGDLCAWMKSVEGEVEVRGGDVLQMRRGGDAAIGDLAEDGGTRALLCMG